MWSGTPQARGAGAPPTWRTLPSLARWLVVVAQDSSEPLHRTNARAAVPSDTSAATLSRLRPVSADMLDVRACAAVMTHAARGARAEAWCAPSTCLAVFTTNHDSRRMRSGLAQTRNGSLPGCERDADCVGGRRSPSVAATRRRTMFLRDPTRPSRQRGQGSPKNSAEFLRCSLKRARPQAASRSQPGNELLPILVKPLRMRRL